MKRNKRKTHEEFVKEATEMYSGKYDYTDTVYINARSKIEIRCPEHDVWQITPNNHLRGHGCAKCAGVSRTTTGEFILKASKVHADKYDYALVNYTNARDKVVITCKLHGNFLMRPYDHLNGKGCAVCSKTGFNPSVPSSLYVLICESMVGTFIGYGITVDVCRRIYEHTVNLSRAGFSISQQHTWDFPIGSSALALENAVKKQFPQTSRLGCDIEGFKRESTDAPFEQVKEFIESILKENPEWQLT